MATVDGFEGTYWLGELERPFLQELLGSVPGDYLEIGTFNGIVAVELAKAFPDKKVHCVDLFRAGYSTAAGNRAIFEKNVVTHGVSNVELFEGDSKVIVPSLPSRCGMIFVDGDHSYSSALADLRNSWAKLLPEGVLAFHDYGGVEDVTRAANDFMSEMRLKMACRVTSIGCVVGKRVDRRALRKVQRWAFSKTHIPLRMRFSKAIAGLLRR